MMLPGLFIGSILAIALLNVIPSDMVKHLFSVMIILVAIWFWRYDQDTDNMPWSLYSSYHHVLTFIQGFLWFLMGVPVFTVPYLCKTNVPLRHAIGCGAFFGVVLSAVGAILFIITGLSRFKGVEGQVGFINVYIVGLSVIPSAIMAAVGVKLSNMLPKIYLQKMYAVLVFISGTVMLL